jgi:hypothetical protein
MEEEENRGNKGWRKRKTEEMKDEGRGKKGE